MSQPGRAQSAHAWAAEVGVTILDPDGWRKHAPLGERSMDDPITVDEFTVRLAVCTIGPAQSGCIPRDHDETCQYRRNWPRDLDEAGCDRCRGLAASRREPTTWPTVRMVVPCLECGSDRPCQHDVPCGIGGCELPAGHAEQQEKHDV